MDGAVKKAGYIFLLGLLTYGWWRLTAGIKRKLDEIDGKKNRNREVAGE